MQLYGPPLPWLDKPAATAAAIAAIGRATAAAGGELAYVEQRRSATTLALAPARR